MNPCDDTGVGSVDGDGAEPPWPVTPASPAGLVEATRPPENDRAERDECGTEDIVHMDTVISREDEEDPVEAIRVKPDDGRADVDAHHCRQPSQWSSSLCDRAGGRLRRLPVLIHVFDMRGTALSRPAPRPPLDFELAARRTSQDPSLVVRRERDRHVVLCRDPVALLRHVHMVPVFWNALPTEPASSAPFLLGLRASRNDPPAIGGYRKKCGCEDLRLFENPHT